jgi:hypothetical protein
MSKISYVPTAQERHEAEAQMARWRHMAQATPVGTQIWRGIVWGASVGFLLAMIVTWW